ncbi:helix-hairpin-helix domain-containing protein [Blastococcus saxobsidens]|uniref:Helix-hairpin-helix domain-containing protein n=1 Tax=Blastococcus saxobsidens TaxID=138336 RepID=A0A6L9W6F5_9ACTN|nr:helix-hairpin-helix domain-containing protein [Blastococcus saxobsidens]NEK87628.1 helix-hairpin-helix domain-containing protein [Blastococcus saxobsidens]
MNDARPQVAAPGRSAPTVLDRLRAGGWYFAVTIFSAGFLAALPFWHAAGRLGRRDVRSLAVAYTLAGVYLLVLMALTPKQADGTSADGPLSTIGGLSVLVVVVAACVQLRPLRRQVYRAGAIVPTSDDPVVARAREAHARRQEARRLIAGEPALRRELGIGRPDLRRGYDDGGLVDLNTASAALIASVCGIEPAHAEAVVAGREARGGTYFNIGEVLVEVPLPPHAQDELRERAVF